MPVTARVLIVDDEVALMRALCDTLAEQGYETVGAGSGQEALGHLQEQDFDLLLTDLMMPVMDGIALLRAALAIEPGLVGIVMTGQGTINTAVEAMKAGAFDYVLKPIRINALIPVLARALEVGRLRNENLRLREALAIYEMSTAIAATLDFDAVLEKVADAACHQGESDDICVLLAAPDGKEFRVAVARGEGSAQWLGHRVPMSEAMAAWLARCRELRSRQGIIDDPHLAVEHPLREYCPGILMPMLAGGELIGLLRVAGPRSHHLATAGQLRTIGILASSAASAVKAAALYSQLSKLNVELEQRIAERTAALIAANRELEAFSYSVSHDLRAPLRAITGFSKLLLEAGEGGSAQETAEWLKRIQANAERMETLIGDLLRLSRVSRQEIHRRDFDISDMAARVAGELAQAHPEHRVQMTIAPGMRVHADPGLIRIVLENLVGNAWKFAARASEARIELGLAEVGGETAHFVRDNGVGFDMQYADRLFAPFQRLHGQDEFEGTGIGLSIVERIVARHGGRVWAEGKVGQGATFFFTLA